MKWPVVLCLAALPALAGEHKIAVAAFEGVLGRTDAASVEEAVRAEARGLDLAVLPGTPAGVAAAAELGATHVITGKVVRLEGALAITLTLLKTEDGAKLGTERLVGYTHPDLQGEVKKKVPRMLRAGLGIGEEKATATATATRTATATATTTATATPTRTATTTATPTTTATANPRPKFVRAPT